MKLNLEEYTKKLCHQLFPYLAFRSPGFSHLHQRILFTFASSTFLASPVKIPRQEASTTQLRSPWYYSVTMSQIKQGFRQYRHTSESRFPRYARRDTQKLAPRIANPEARGGILPLPKTTILSVLRSLGPSGVCKAGLAITDDADSHDLPHSVLFSTVDHSWAKKYWGIRGS